jgi:hypothetical protein
MPISGLKGTGEGRPKEEQRDFSEIVAEVLRAHIQKSESA